MEVMGNYEDVQFPQEMKDHALQGMQNVLDWMDTQPDLRSKMSGVYHMIDEVNKRSFAKEPHNPPSCKMGCAHCCHIQVACTEWEVDLIIDYMNHIGVEFDEKDIEVMKEQAKLKDTNDYIQSPHRRCVFLQEDNSCGIYEARPATCRNYYVFSPPEDCDTFNPNNPGRVSVNFNIDTVIPILALGESSQVDMMPQHFLNKLGIK